MPIVIITRNKLLDLVLQTGLAGTGDGPTPTLHQGEDAFGGRPDQERALEDSALAALGLERFVLPAGNDPVVALARAALVAAHNRGYQADRGDSDEEETVAERAEGALLVGIGMLCAGQLPAPHAGPARFYSITTSHADPADGANLLPVDHRVVLVEPMGELGYRYLVEKPPTPTANMFDRFASDLRIGWEAGQTRDIAASLWDAMKNDPRAPGIMAEEGWDVCKVEGAWTIVRKSDAYLWETDASALGFVREQALRSLLHQAAVNLHDAQAEVSRIEREGARP